MNWLESLEKIANIGTALGAILGFIVTRVWDFWKSQDEKKQKLAQDIKEEIESINGILKSLHEPKALYFRKYLSNEIKRHIDNIHSGRNQAEVNNCFIDMHIIITTDGVDYETFSATASKLMNHLNQLIEG